MTGSETGTQSSGRRRALRAVFSSDIAGFSGQVSVDETNALITFSELRTIAMDQLKKHNGWLFGMPGDGLFALFESAIDAVQCGLELQERVSARPELNAMRMRIGIHMGEVLFDGDLPFGEALAIAARLESLAEPGTILVSGPVFDAVAARVSATFENRGTPQLKNIPRRVATYAVSPTPAAAQRAETPDAAEPDLMDRTMHLDRDLLRQVRDGLLQPETQEPPPVDTAKSAHENQEETEQPGQPGSTGQAPISQAPTEAPSAQELVCPAPEAPALIDPADLALRQDTSVSLHFRDQLVELLTYHIGPLARLMVNRHADHATSAHDLIERVEQEIPDGDERMSFRLRATQHLLNPDAP